MGGKLSGLKAKLKKDVVEVKKEGATEKPAEESSTLKNKSKGEKKGEKTQPEALSDQDLEGKLREIRPDTRLALISHYTALPQQRGAFASALHELDSAPSPLLDILSSSHAEVFVSVTDQEMFCVVCVADDVESMRCHLGHERMKGFKGRTEGWLKEPAKHFLFKKPGVG